MGRWRWWGRRPHSSALKWAGAPWGQRRVRKQEEEGTPMGPHAPTLALPTLGVVWLRDP